LSTQIFSGSRAQAVNGPILVFVSNVQTRFLRLPKSAFFERVQAGPVIQLESPKFHFHFSEIYAYLPAIPHPQGGAFRPIVTIVGHGMRWTQGRRETSAAGADGEIVWS